MIKGIYSVARALDAKMKKIEIVANNLANINTTGFKRDVPFSEYITNENSLLQVKEATDFNQGELNLTSNPLDVAISGKGFFVLENEDGLMLTRNGHFKISEDGYLVSQDGNRILGKSGAINVNEFLLDKNNKLEISKQGEIKISGKTVDTLLIALPDELNSTSRTGGVNFKLDNDYSIANENDYVIAQGYLEDSNVNPIIEMQEMIEINNNFDSAHKLMNFLDQSLQKSNEIGRV